MLTLLALAALCLASQTGESPTLPQPVRRRARTPHSSPLHWQSLWLFNPLLQEGRRNPFALPLSLWKERGESKLPERQGRGLRGKLGSFLL